MKIMELFTGNKDLFPKKGNSLPQLLQKNINEILEMSDYASGKGIDLADPLPDQIAQMASLSIKLDETLKIQLGQVSDVDHYKDDLSLAIKVHNQLSRLITPVSAASLIATQPGIFKHNTIMMVSIISTIVSLIILIGNLFWTEILPITVDDESKRQLFRGLLDYTSVVFAAILGSGVYSMYTARKYLVKRTFDPKYNSVYTLRFVLGIALGTILGLFGDDLGVSGHGAEDAGVAEKLGPVVLAIVGGFSSDAVASILQRLAETLQVIVKGNGESMVEFETEKAMNLEKNKATKILLDIKNQVSSGQVVAGDTGNIINAIDSYIAAK